MSIPPTSEQKHTYTGIQALRFVAAMLVVLAHSTAMVNECMKGWKVFITRRPIRIVHLYWVSVVINIFSTPSVLRII